MVFVKYKIINGKRYGPYYYENKRVGKKIITTYYGKYHPSSHEPSSFSSNNYRQYFFLLGIILFIILVGSFIYSSFSPTGRATLAFDESLQVGELLGGTLTLGLESGEFLPADTQVVVSLGDTEKTFALYELVSNAPVSGTYYASGVALSGTGQGYGAVAERVYPEVSFELIISKGESGSTGGNVEAEKKEEKAKDEPKKEQGIEEKQKEEEKKENEKSEEVKEEVQEKEEKNAKEAVKEEKAESNSETSSPVETGEQTITGAVVAENTEIVSGSVRKGEIFTYELKVGERVSLKSGSVKITGQSVDDGSVQIASTDGKVIATTEHETQVNASESVQLKIELSRFNITAEKGTLNVRVIAQGSEIVQVSKKIEVEVEEETESIANMTDESNETLDDVSNATIVNLTGMNVTVLGNETIGNATVKTSRAKIRVGERVKWVKNVSLERAENVTVELPKEAENVSVKKIEESGREEEAKAEVRGITGNVIHGEVTAEIELAKEGGFMRFVRGLFGGATGRVIAKDNASAGINESATTGEMIVVTLSDNATSYTIEYYTEAPIAYEQNISSGKQVVISGPDGLNYTDVISFTTIEERFAVGQESAIQIYWLENKSFIDFIVGDTQGNGLLDYVEWITPHLSNQTFNITLGAGNVNMTSIQNITIDGDYMHLTVSSASPYDSLVGYWSFDGDNSTTAFDWTANNNDGNYTADATKTTGCLYNDCAIFDGTGDNIVVSESSSLRTNSAVSVLMWIKPDSDAPAAVLGIRSPSEGNGWQVGYKDSGSNSLYYIGTGAWTSLTGAAPTAAEWHHLAFTWDSSSTVMTIYLDGAWQADTTKSGTIADGAATTYIGSYNNGASNFKGLIDEVMIFNVDIGATNVANIFNNQSARFKARGVVAVNQTNFTSNKEHLNVTVRNYERAQGSNISLRVREYNSSWSYTPYQNLSGNAGDTQSSNRINISYLTTNASLDFLLLPGNGTTSSATKSFYSPLLLASASANITVNAVHNPLYVNSCDTLSGAGKQYFLTRGIGNASGNCIIITASNIVLDGQGYNITYGSGGTGVGISATSVNNITIKNVVINKSTADVTTANNYGISFLTVTNSTIQNVTVRTNGTAFNIGLLVNSSNNNTLINNTIFTGGSSSNNNGISISDSNTTTVTFNTINNSNGNALYVDTATSNNNIIINNSIISSASLNLDLEIATAALNNTFFIDQAIRNYSFTGVGSKIIVNDSRFGVVSFLDTINGSGSNLSNMIRIGNNSVYVNSTVSGGGSFNKSANVTFFNTPTYYLPEIRRDEVTCPSNVCTALTSLTGPTISFNVTGWSNYSIFENAILVSACGTLSTAGGQYVLTQGIGNASGNCIIITGDNIVLDGQGYNITYGSGGRGNGVYASSRSNITIKNVHINKSTQSVSNSDNYGIQFITTSNSKIENVTIRTNGTSDNYGIFAWSGSDGNNITSNTITTSGTTGNYGIGLFSSSNNIILNTITTDGTSDNYGIRVSGGDRNNITSNTINNTNGAAISLSTITTTQNVFINNSIISSANRYLDLEIVVDSLNNTFFIDQAIRNYSFTGVGSKITVNDSRFGVVSFLDTINGSGGNLSNAIIIGNDSAFINETVGESGLNRSANITFTGMSIVFSNPVILRDGVICNATLGGCNNFTALTAGTVRFNTTIAGNYTIDERPDEVIPENITFVPWTLADETNQTLTEIRVNVTANDNVDVQAIVIRLYNASRALNTSRQNASSPHAVNFSGLADGVWYFNATVNDSKNNINETATRTIRIDTTVPNMSYGSGTETNATYTTRTYLIVNVTASDATVGLANITIFVLNSLLAVFNQTTRTSAENYVNVSGLSDGAWYFNASAKDYLNWENTTERRTVTVDTTRPQIGFGAETANSNVNMSRTWIYLNLSLNETNVANVTYTLYYQNGTSVNVTTYASATTIFNWTSLTDGTYTYNATVTDLVNYENTTENRRITLDTTKPAIGFGAGTETNATAFGRTWVYANISLNETNFANVTFTLQNASGIVNQTMFTDTTRSLNWTNLTDGVYYYNATAMDYAGNVNTTIMRMITLDTVGPNSISFVTPTDSDNANVSRNSTYVNVTATDSAAVQAIVIRLYNASRAENMSRQNASSPHAVNFSDLPDGVWYFNATVNDSVGTKNETETRRVVLDTTMPNVTYTSGTEVDGATITRTYAVVNVSASDTLSGVVNLTVVFYNATRVEINRSTNTSGTLVYTNFSGLVNGTYYYNATSTDYAGNRNTTATRTVIVSTNPVIVTFGDGTESNGTYQTRTNIYVNASVTNVSALSTIAIRLYNTSRSENTSSINSTAGQHFVNWTGLADGVWYFNATANDISGNNASTQTLQVTIDTTRPGIGFGAGVEATGTNWSRSWIYVNLSLNETNVANVTYTLYNQTASVNVTVYASAQTTLNWTGLADGNYTYNVSVSDLVNYENTTENRRITLDTTRPLISFGVGTEEDSVARSRQWLYVNVSVTEANEQNITFTLWNLTATVNVTTFTDARRTINWTGLADGNYNYNVSVSDYVNNRNTTATRSFVVDIAIPTTITFVTPTESDNANLTTRNEILVNVTATDSATLSRIVIRLFNATNSNVANRVNTSSPHNVNFTGLDDGRYYFNASVNDTAGNENQTGTRTVLIDTQPPNVLALRSDDVVQYGNATLQINASDLGFGLQAANAQVWYGNGTWIANYTMTLNATSGVFNLTLWNLSVIADYDVNYSINDTIGRQTNTSDYFEVYRPLGTTIRGNVTDSAGTQKNYTYIFRRPGTNITLLNFTNNSYSFAADELKNRTYDLEIRVGTHVLVLRSLNLTTTYIPVNVDNLSTSITNITNYKILAGLGVNTTYTGNATLNFSYTYNADGAAVVESGLTVHRCADWNYTDRVCNEGFALYGNKTVFSEADRMIVNASSFSSYLVTEYTCGNSICQAAYGETISTCAGDCAPASSSSSSSGGGGGGGGGGTAANATQEQTRQTTGGNLQVGLAKIERELTIGENVTERLTLINGKDIALDVRFLLDKALRRVMEVPEKINIESGETKVTDITIRGSKEGVYQGNLYLESIDFNQSIPVQISVLSLQKKLLDISVSLLKERVPAGSELPFKVEIYNLGQERRYDIALTYDVVRKATNESILHKEEQTIIGGMLSVVRSVELPKDTENGEYKLIVTADYGEGKAEVFASFAVQGGLIFGTIKEYANTVLLLIVVGFILFIGMYYLVSLRRQLKTKQISEKLKNSVYPAPDFLTLPQSKYAHVGLIADADEPAYLDHTQLNRHTLIAGGTGCGKTVAAMDVVEELLKKGVGVVVFDPVGQWSGFAKRNTDEKMRRLYPKFKLGLPQAFKPRIVEISDATMNIDVVHYMQEKGLTILRMDRLTPKKVDAFIEGALGQIYRANLNESGSLKSLVVLDEVHRLLPKYGGRKAYTKLEQAVREFRKWGIGLLMISQVLTDFKGAIRGNIGTEIQMHTRYEGDIKRVRERHGANVSKLIAKLSIGIGMVECSEYNKGNPYFIEFRPLLHSPYKLTETEAKQLVKKETPILRMDAGKK